MEILIVCLGNICRSPLAQGILEKHVADHGLEWRVDSAGTGNWHIGEKPDERSIAVARKYGIDLTHQRARQFRGQDFETYDRILVMDQSNYNDVMRLAQNDEERKKVDLILNLSEPGSNRAVPDPYWDDDGFESVYRMLDEACLALINSRDKADNKAQQKTDQ